jgi:hypothetical protein
MARRDGRYLRPAVDARLRAQIPFSGCRGLSVGRAGEEQIIFGMPEREGCFDHVAATDLGQQQVARVPFDQSHDVAVRRAAQEIAFPVARHRSILDLRSLWKHNTYQIRTRSSGGR